MKKSPISAIKSYLWIWVMVARDFPGGWTYPRWPGRCLEDQRNRLCRRKPAQWWRPPVQWANSPGPRPVNCPMGCCHSLDALLWWWCSRRGSIRCTAFGLIRQDAMPLEMLRSQSLSANVRSSYWFDGGSCIPNGRNCDCEKSVIHNNRLMNSEIGQQIRCALG